MSGGKHIDVIVKTIRKEVDGPVHWTVRSSHWVGLLVVKLKALRRAGKREVPKANALLRFGRDMIDRVTRVAEEARW